MLLSFRDETIMPQQGRILRQSHAGTPTLPQEVLIATLLLHNVTLHSACPVPVTPAKGVVPSRLQEHHVSKPW